ncbi:MAG: TIGR00730 family Rossman fold protein [Ktedonobacteraceae bacterium]|nr:TIGR00730 family Rossman fold protein [Ktedonobacteraceae bacterium]
MRRICIFAGSNAGIRPEYRQAARLLGQELVKRGLGIVYGGASVGLMGTIADEMRERGGEVIGVLPKGLFVREVAHANLSELHEVGTMHERKALMADLADGFIALPGGYGTFDELFEITTWSQIGLHKKPIGVLNIEGYFTPLLALITHATTEGFILPFHTHLLLQRETPGELLDAFAAFQPPDTQIKWAELPPQP